MYNGLERTNNLDGFLGGASVAVIVLVLLALLIGCAIAVFLIVAYCKLYKKAGQDWWKALIPLYNSWIDTKIVGLAWYWFIIFAVLSALSAGEYGADKSNFVIFCALILTSFNYNFNLAKKFGKSNGFAVLLTLLPIVGLPILAFGNATYDQNAKVDENGIFSVKNR